MAARVDAFRWARLPVTTGAGVVTCDIGQVWQGNAARDRGRVPMWGGSCRRSDRSR
jgi:hypothetical protein